MSIERDDLLKLASDLTDELAVDWTGERANRPDVAKILAELETLERLARVQREARERKTPAPALFSWGTLRVTARLGEGGAAEVWRAFDPALQRDVALKLRRSGEDVAGSSARRWLDEARRLARVRHGHVLAIYGADLQEGRAGLWCELIEGRTLEALLAEGGPLGAREAAVIGMDLCGALAAVHGAGIVHGDVKTSNVMRETGGRIVLMDLGAGSDIRPGDAGGTPVEFATPHAAAPEVVRGEGATPQSDLWSLGALLYRLVTGRHAVEGSTFREVRERQERGERVPLRDLRADLPAPFVDAVECALAHDPAKRHASAGAMERALSLALAPPEPERIAPAPSAKASPSGARLAAGLGALALVAALATLWAVRPRTAAGPAAGSGPSVGAMPAPAATEAPSAAPGPAAPRPVSAPDLTLFATRDSAAVALESEARVRPGDQLFLEVQSAGDLTLYVLDEDEAGQVYVLFPSPGFDVANPLAAGVRHRLPGRRDSEVHDWQVTSAGGREHLLVLALAQPNATIADAVARLAAGERLDGGSAPPRRARRGIGGSAPSTVPGSEPANLRALERLAESERRAGRAWLRSWTLDNPR